PGTLPDAADHASVVRPHLHRHAHVNGVTDELLHQWREELEVVLRVDRDVVVLLAGIAGNPLVDAVARVGAARRGHARVVGRTNRYRLRSDTAVGQFVVDRVDDVRVGLNRACGVAVRTRAVRRLRPGVDVKDGDSSA